MVSFKRTLVIIFVIFLLFAMLCESKRILKKRKKTSRIHATFKMAAPYSQRKSATRHNSRRTFMQPNKMKYSFLLPVVRHSRRNMRPSLRKLDYDDDLDAMPAIYTSAVRRWDNAELPVIEFNGYDIDDFDAEDLENLRRILSKNRWEDYK